MSGIIVVIPTAHCPSCLAPRDGVEPSFPPLLTAQSHSVSGPDRWLFSQSTTSASRRKFLKEAILLYSGGIHHPRPLKDSPPPGAKTANPLQHLSSQPRPQSSFLRSARGLDPGPPPQPRPLLGTPSQGISVFFKANTWCFPGATVPVNLGKLPGLLQSLPSSITPHSGVYRVHRTEQTCF